MSTSTKSWKHQAVLVVSLLAFSTTASAAPLTYDVANGNTQTEAAALAGSEGLIKTGGGTLNLTSGSSTYTGGTTINGGILRPTTDRSLGAVPGSFEAANIVINNGSTLHLGNNATNTNADLHANRGITLGAGMQTILKDTRRSVNIRGVISGDGGIIFDDSTGFNQDGGGGGRLHLFAANTFTGDSVIKYAGQKDPGIWLQHSLALQNSTLVYDTSNIIGAAGDLVWFNSGNASHTLGGLSGNRNLNLSPQGNRANDLRIGNNNKDTLYSGAIVSSNDPNAKITKIGTGTLTLTGASTYAGGTTVENGTLLVNNTTGSGTGSGAVTVNGGLLGGTGIISGAITVNPGGAVAPGASIGTLRGSSLTWNSDDLLAGMAFELSNVDNTSDLLDLSGAFTKGTGNTFLFNFVGGTAGETYTLIEFGSTNFLASDFGVASGTNGTFAIVDNTLQFNALASVLSVPEPITLALWSIVGLLAVGYWWRKST